MAAYISSQEKTVVYSGDNKERDYWLNKLSGEIQKTAFPYDRSRVHADGNDLQPGLSPFSLSGELFSRLMKLSKESDLKLHMTLAAGLVTLLHKYSGSDDIIIGTPVLKQQKQEDFINTVLALRNEIKDGMTFKALLLQVRQSIIEATENQNYPIETLIYKLNLPGTANGFPLFDVAILLENIHTKDYIGHIKYNMLFSFQRVTDSIKAVIQYNPLLYKEKTIARIGEHFSNILLAAVINVDQPISDLHAISEKEKHLLLFAWNDTFKEIVRDKCYHGLFEEQVKKNPEHTAVIGMATPEPGLQTHLTYKELNHKANCLAELLKEKGISRDHLVGILCRRWIEMLISILGVFKAGGAYIPIEIDNPPDRIKRILEDSGAKALLLMISSIPGIPINEFYPEIDSAAPVKHIIYLGQLGSMTTKYPERYAGVVNQPSDLCYVIYTSGTTGMPKGVMIHHLGMLNHLYAKIDGLSITHRDIVAQTANAGFDISVWQFLSAILIGGRTVIIAKDVIVEPKKFLRVLQQQQVTILESVPSLIQAFLEMLSHERNTGLTTLRWLITTGEALSVHLASNWMRCYPGIKLVNAYGPTEAADDITHYVVKQMPEPDQQGIPIGKPLQNLNVFVLDRQLNLCPPYVRGEICVGGIGIGRGYLNDPEKTRKSFVPNPLSDRIRNHGYQVLYKTGDVGFLREDGNIECLGRLDNQVKIRGNRIELGEIESRLLDHQGIKESIVVAKEDAQGNKFLCAYFIPANPSVIPELREFLLEQLPDYMVPTYFVPLDHIPLTPNGKIDINALPELKIKSEEAYTPPRDDKEKKLAEIFEKVLARTGIGINENFFMIGGDSIKSIQIISRLSSAGYKIEVKDLFDHPTIAQLAKIVKESSRIVDQSEVTGVVPLTPVQASFFEEGIMGSSRFTFSFMLRLKEPMDEKVIRAIFTKLQAHHDALRMTFKKGTDKIDGTNGRVIQTNHGVDYPLSLVVYDFRYHKNPSETLLRRANEMLVEIDLENGPLMKVGLFHLIDASRLLIVIHHLVSDGVSWRILFEDLETLYQQYKKGEDFSLPLKTDSFKTWAEKLSQYANSELFLEEKTYWSEQEIAEVSPLKKDFQEEKNYMKDSVRKSFRLTEEETELLLTKVHTAFGTEINDMLLTAFGLSIKAVYGHDKVLIMQEGHGREEILEDVNISRTLGWFTSEFPTLLDISYSYDLARQIIEIKEYLRRIPHRGIGYGILKYLTADEYKQDMEFKSKPQIIFNYLGQIDTDAAIMSFGEMDEFETDMTTLEEKREYQWDVVGVIEKKQLVMSITFSKKQYKQETMDTLLAEFKKELIRIIAFCSERQRRELTPSDLTYKKLSIETLQRLSTQYPVEDIYSLTPMQEGMLFHALYQKKSSMYSVQRSYRMEGKLEIALVEKTVKELIKRHDIFRTAFVYEGVPHPLQVVLKERLVDFFFEDLRQVINEDEKNRIIKAFKEKDLERGFELSKDVLIRLAVFQVHEATYEFNWTFHHIVMDGWCMEIVGADFSEIYNSLAQNRPLRLPPVTPYRKYIQWLEKKSKEEAKYYWKNYLDSYQKLATIPMKKNLPVDHESYKAEEVGFIVDIEKTRQLQYLSGQNQVTLNTIIQSIWGIVLGRYNGNNDVVYGTVVSGRPAEIENVESIVGLFINTIPVRIRFEETTKFIDLVKKVQEEAIQGQSYHYYSLAKIQAETKLKRDLLDHILAFENIQIETQTGLLENPDEEKNKVPEFKLSNMEGFLQTNYNFNIVITPIGQLCVLFKFNSLIYESDFVKKIASHIKAVIDQILEDPQKKISEIDIIGREEKNKLIQKVKEGKGEHSCPDEETKKRDDKLEAVLNF